MLLETFELRLGQPGRDAIRQDWNKAESRLSHDATGAITAARSMIESVCLYALAVLRIPDTSKGDLPKLYGLVATGLGIAAGSQTSIINKRMFGAVHAIVQSVGELRNKVGDAHGRGGGEVRGSRAQAHMAVNLAASVTDFLLQTVDSYIATAHRRTADGGAILRFDRATVWRLVDHAQNSPTHLPAYGEKRVKPSLWLVGDAGVYLMSNGSPPQLSNGRIVDSEKAKQSLRLVAYAEGCGPADELDDWWPIHNAVAEGSDFSITIPMERILSSLASSERQIVITGTETELRFYSDTEYQVESL